MIVNGDSTEESLEGDIGHPGGNISTAVEPSESCESKDAPARETWGRQIEYLISCVGYIVGFGNIWRFPYLCMRNGGGAFLIPYFTFLFIAGIPLFFLEQTLGQFSSRSAVSVWDFCPLFKGLGWGMVVVTWLLSIYYQSLISWVLYYLVSSFQNPLPWSHCNNSWNTPNCITRGVEYIAVLNDSVQLGNSSRGNLSFYSADSMPGSFNVSNGMTSTEEFWQYNALEMTDSIDNLGGIRWQIVLAHILGWTVNMLCVLKGIKTSGKVVYVTATLPYVFLTVLLIRGCTLPGSVNGILYYIKPNFQKLQELNVWAEACMQIFYSLGPAWGGIITMASYNKFNHNLYKDAIVIPLINCLTSFFSGFVMFSVLGFMAYEANLPVDKVVTSGPGLAFIAYPEALARLPFSPAWAVVFFIMLFTMGLDSQFVTFETTVSGLVDEYPKTFRKKRPYVMLTIGTVNILLGLVFCTRAGIYFFQIMDWFCGAFTAIAMACLECVVVIYFYGGRRFMYDVSSMLGYTPCYGWLVLIGGIAPISLFMCLLYLIVVFDSPTYGDYVYPVWAKVMGSIVAATSCVPIFGFMVYQLLKTKGTFLQRLRKSVKTPSWWGPVAEEYRKDYKYCDSAHEMTDVKVPLATSNGKC